MQKGAKRDVFEKQEFNLNMFFKRVLKTLVSNLFGLHIIRTAKKPFIESHASWPVYMSTIIICFVAIMLPYTTLGSLIGLVPVTLNYLNIIIGIPVLYCVVALFTKKIYIKKYKEWI